MSDSINISNQIQKIEDELGLPPWVNFDRNWTPSQLALIKQWIILRGATTSGAAKLKPEHLAKCYDKEAYLKSVALNNGWKFDYEPALAKRRELPNIDDLDFYKDKNARQNINDIHASIFKSDSNAEEFKAEQKEKTNLNFELNTNLEYVTRPEFEQRVELVEKAVKLARPQDILPAITQRLDNTIKKMGEALGIAHDRSKADILKSSSELVQGLLAKFDAAHPRELVIINRKSETELDSDTKTNLGLVHKNFDKLLRACQAKLPGSGFSPNIWLTGPTGSGKTTAATQIAKALKLEIGIESGLDADYKVIGFRDATGNYHQTMFRKLFENGGLYVADEIDTWNPSALLCLNSALANGQMAFPDGMIPRHKDFIVIACANTWGHGATNDYVGRSKLDAASLNRFLPKIDWEIDEDLELNLACQHGADAKSWCETVQSARHKAKTKGLKIIISPRDTFAGIALIQAGFNPLEVATMTFLAGISSDQRAMLGY